VPRMMQKLVQEWKRFPEESAAGLKNALREKAIRTDEFSIRECFGECHGYEALHGTLRDFQRTEMRQVREAAGAVSSDAFLNITQQFAFQAVLDAYDLPELVVKKLIPSRTSNLKFERVPGVSHIGDELGGAVAEGKDFPEFGVSEDWIDTPETVKRGGIIPVTKETIFFDQTGIVMQRLSMAGEWLGVNDEKRAIDCVIDAGETSSNQYRYRWRNNTIATYGDNSGNHTWDNLQASNALATYANIETAWKLLVAITDPFTGEPQNVTLKHIVVPPDLAFTVPFALKGMVKKVAPGYATSGNPVSTEIDNPTGDIIGNIQTVTSQLIKARMTAAGSGVYSAPSTSWFVGDISAAFEEIVNWPLQVLQLGAGSQDEFKRDIVMQFRADKRSTYSTKQPRKMVRCDA
jgi:hypothetical protein